MVLDMVIKQSLTATGICQILRSHFSTSWHSEISCFYSEHMSLSDKHYGKDLTDSRCLEEEFPLSFFLSFSPAWLGIVFLVLIFLVISQLRTCGSSCLFIFTVIRLWWDKALQICSFLIEKQPSFLWVLLLAWWQPTGMSCTVIVRAGSGCCR